jgi:hypothetical protein
MTEEHRRIVLKLRELKKDKDEKCIMEVTLKLIKIKKQQEQKTPHFFKKVSDLKDKNLCGVQFS